MTPVWSHPATMTTLEVKILRDGTFQAYLNIDVLAFGVSENSLTVSDKVLTALLDGPRDKLIEALHDSGERFKHEVVVRAGSTDIPVRSWTLPQVSDVDDYLAQKIEPRLVIPGEIRFSGRIPLGAKTITFRLPYILGDTLRTFQFPGGDSTVEPVAAGGYSTPVPLPFFPLFWFQEWWLPGLVGLSVAAVAARRLYLWSVRRRG